jgi:hypothetical protein
MKSVQFLEKEAATSSLLRRITSRVLRMAA